MQGKKFHGFCIIYRFSINRENLVNALSYMVALSIQMKQKVQKFSLHWMKPS